MLKKSVLIVSVVALAIACTGKMQNAKGTKLTATTPVAAQFGAPTTPANAITYDALVMKMKDRDSLKTKVTGKVSEVCQKKGCWMTLVPDQPGAAPMRVTFKDYAFFMPKDLSGKRVVVDGIARIETTAVDVLRHYAEDAGKTKAEIEAIKVPKRELAFEAAGVLILK